MTYRTLTPEEILLLEAAGNSADDWSAVEVAASFSPAQLRGAHLGGRVRIGDGACIRRSTVRNYAIGAGALVEDVTALECRHASAFGNGVGVATMNECGGRTVAIYDRMTAQLAYVAAVWRHRPATIARIGELVARYAAARTGEQGEVGAGSRIVGCRFVREVRIGAGVTVEGASLLENGTVCDGAAVGVDVQAEDFIIAEGAFVGGGSRIERCFVGECCKMDKGFTAAESLFFANCHCENGEAVSIFAGPYTVSHHKSSLLIAGIFSFFNAGSGTNQSNHLFKSGAVHQSAHLRGCKFASNAYVMSPAAEGAFTMILGRHTAHHDTTALPFSYLIEREGRSTLMPAANLTSYGTVRDIEKWPARDRRTVRRDTVDFAEHNPYVTGMVLQGLDTLNELAERDPGAQSYLHGRVTIRAVQLQRGIKLYNKAVVAAMGAMLAGVRDEACDGRGRWIDAAGQYITRRAVEEALDALDAAPRDADAAAVLEAFDERCRAFGRRYEAYARSWAEALLGQLLGHTPSEAEIAEAVEAGRRVGDELRRTAELDLARDCAPEMAVSYGLDAAEEAERMADFRAVRNLTE